MQDKQRPVIPIERAPHVAWTKPCSFAVANDSGVVCRDGSEIVARDSQSGEERWRLAVEARSHLRISGEAVVVTTDTISLAYDLRTGRSLSEYGVVTSTPMLFRVDEERYSVSPYRDEDAYKITITDITSGDTEVIANWYSHHPLTLAIAQDVAYIGEPDSDYNSQRGGVRVSAHRFRKGRLWEFEIVTMPRPRPGFPLSPPRSIEQLIPLSNGLLVVANDETIYCLVSRPRPE